MSPILLRPIREQFEHDRVIRQLQARWRRRFAVVANPGKEQGGSVRFGNQILYPDLILTTAERGRKLNTLVEVETAESVNHLEAMAQWAHLGKARGVFYLYVPAGQAEVALRLCKGDHINVAEVWTYYAVGSQMRFSMAYRSPRATQAAKAKTKTKTKAKTKTQATVRAASKAKPRPKTVKKAKKTKSAKTIKAVKAKRVSKGTKKPKAKTTTGTTRRKAASKRKK